MSKLLTFGLVSHPSPRWGFTYTEPASFPIAPQAHCCHLARAVQHYPTHGEMEVKSKRNDRRTARSALRPLLLGASLCLMSAGLAQNAFAGQWVQTGRVLLLDSEGIAPYIVSWTNTCQGGVEGPSGFYTYGDWGPEGLGSCPSDANTGWAANYAGSVGYCRPEPEHLGGGYSCTEYSHTFGGQTYSGAIPATCSTPGTYAISYMRRAELVYSGNGNMPNDYYDRVNEVSAEFYCQQ